MSNFLRLGISALVSLILTAIAYLSMFSFTPLLYFFAPGFWLGDALPDSFVNALGGYLFPVFASAIIWTLLIFGIWWLIARTKNRSRR
jgi:ribose/xylose/arabinose/galactoside ABC-type transport system permease subunit